MFDLTVQCVLKFQGDFFLYFLYFLNWMLMIAANAFFIPGITIWSLSGFVPSQCQPYKMVKHTQTIRRLLPTNYLGVLDHFVGLARNVQKS